MSQSQIIISNIRRGGQGSIAFSIAHQKSNASTQEISTIAVQTQTNVLKTSTSDSVAKVKKVEPAGVTPPTTPTVSSSTTHATDCGCGKNKNRVQALQSWAQRQAQSD